MAAFRAMLINGIGQKLKTMDFGGESLERTKIIVASCIKASQQL